MNRAMAMFILVVLSTNAWAGCIPAAEKNLLWLRALLQGSVKVFVNHSELAYGTPIDSIEAATAATLGEINSDGTFVYMTQSWVPRTAPGFEAYVTFQGVQKLYDEGYCFARID